MRQTVPAYKDTAPRDVFLAAVKNSVPLGREQTPEDIGQAVVYLAQERHPDRRVSCWDRIPVLLQDEPRAQPEQPDGRYILV